MNIKYLIIALVLSPLTIYAQTGHIDTLKLDTKNGQKIILIGNDLNSFKTIKADSLIQKALLSVKDSLVVKKPAGYQITKKDFFPWVLTKKRAFVFYPGIGIGLIRDKISPFMGLALDFAPQRQDYYYAKGAQGEYTFMDIAVNAFYSVEKDIAGNYHNYTNIFLEASIGNRINNKIKRQYNFDEFSFGAGYLIKDQGGYFKGNTYKIFVSAVPVASFVRFRPEVIFTDDFNKVFPGLAISGKLFGERQIFPHHNRKKNASPAPASGKY